MFPLDLNKQQAGLYHQSPQRHHRVGGYVPSFAQAISARPMDALSHHVHVPHSFPMSSLPQSRSVYHPEHTSYSVTMQNHSRAPISSQQTLYHQHAISQQPVTPPYAPPYTHSYSQQSQYRPLQPNISFAPPFIRSSKKSAGFRMPQAISLGVAFGLFFLGIVSFFL